MTRKVSRSGHERGVDKALKDRASKSIEHIFTLLGLVFPRRHVRLAFRALHAEDGKMSGVALEYLDSILPRSLREELTAHFESSPGASGAVLTQEEVAKLVDSNPSMMHRLEYWIDPTNSSKGE